MDYNAAGLLTNGVFMHGIKLLAGSMWCVFLAWLAYKIYFD